MESPITTNQSLFQRLAQIDCSKHVEKKRSGNGVELSYLSWAWAWQIFKLNCPDATYRVREWDGKPYLFDPALGYLVETEITTSECGKLSMRLPIMDGANKAQKHIDYTYKTRAGEKTVPAATMFDVNTAIMRCLVKNIAMFGLGLNIYAGEDLPVDSEQIENVTTIPQAFGEADQQAIAQCKNAVDLKAYCASRKRVLRGNELAKLVAAFKARLAEIDKPLMDSVAQ